MYCKSCGNEVADGARFCKSCGAAQETALQSTPEQTKTEAKTNANTKKKLPTGAIVAIIIAAVIVIGAVAGGIVYSSSKDKDKQENVPSASSSSTLENNTENKTTPETERHTESNNTTESKTTTKNNKEEQTSKKLTASRYKVNKKQWENTFKRENLFGKEIIDNVTVTVNSGYGNIYYCDGDVFKAESLSGGPSIYYFKENGKYYNASDLSEKKNEVNMTMLKGFIQGYMPCNNIASEYYIYTSGIDKIAYLGKSYDSFKYNEDTKEYFSKEIKLNISEKEWEETFAARTMNIEYTDENRTIKNVSVKFDNGKLVSFTYSFGTGDDSITLDHIGTTTIS